MDSLDKVVVYLPMAVDSLDKAVACLPMAFLSQEADFTVRLLVDFTAAALTVAVDSVADAMENFASHAEHVACEVVLVLDDSVDYQVLSQGHCLTPEKFLIPLNHREPVPQVLRSMSIHTTQLVDHVTSFNLIRRALVTKPNG